MLVNTGSYTLTTTILFLAVPSFYGSTISFVTLSSCVIATLAFLIFTA